MSVVEMMMMIPMKSSSMTVTMATISPSGREFPRQISACRRALFSLVFFRPAEAAVSILDVPPHALGFSGDEVREGEMAEGGRGPPPHMAARQHWWPRRPMGRAHGGPPQPPLLAGSVFWKNKSFGIFSVNC